VDIPARVIEARIRVVAYSINCRRTELACLPAKASWLSNSVGNGSAHAQQIDVRSHTARIGDRERIEHRRGNLRRVRNPDPGRDLVDGDTHRHTNRGHRVCVTNHEHRLSSYGRLHATNRDRDDGSDHNHAAVGLNACAVAFRHRDHDRSHDVGALPHDYFSHTDLGAVR